MTGAVVQAIYQFYVLKNYKRKKAYNFGMAEAILDSFTLSQNYFGGHMSALRVLAEKRLKAIDLHISAQPLSSIHWYVAYGYLFMLAQELNEG